ncbi:MULTISPECIES: hypothetical protein [unclassified Pseudophaeobacter]|uniref:hypothetical protein n=1 Tax=unclassified Pseudophaeobacter TaxID=2637024 RepID=UPI000EFC72B7|nr:hypothetical protein [Pseudophaeobacter sp. EL27]
MLINIYARSMMTATRHPCVMVRDMPAATQPAPVLAAAEPVSKKDSRGFAALVQQIKRLASGLRPTARRLNQPMRCIDLQKL